jgi:hypothetical protein
VLLLRKGPHGAPAFLSGRGEVSVRREGIGKGREGSGGAEMMMGGVLEEGGGVGSVNCSEKETTEGDGRRRARRKGSRGARRNGVCRVGGGVYWLLGWWWCVHVHDHGGRPRARRNRKRLVKKLFFIKRRITTGLILDACDVFWHRRRFSIKVASYKCLHELFGYKKKSFLAHAAHVSVSRVVCQKGY